MPLPKKTATPMLSTLNPGERSLVLDRLLKAHPHLAAEAEQTASDVLGDTTIEAVADEIIWAIDALDLGDLASRSGRQPGRAYVHETEAAYELVEELVQPFVSDLQRRAKLGLTDAARAVGLGTISGLHQCEPATDGTILAYAGEDTPQRCVPVGVTVRAFQVEASTWH